VSLKAAQQGLAGLIGAALVSGCTSPGYFTTDELITVTETSTTWLPTATTITSVTNPVTTMLGDGVYRVGKDVAAGRYATDGAPVQGVTCLWSLLPSEDAPVGKALSGGFAQGPGQLTVSLGDIIATRGGCNWMLTQ
jgi:hypothetical protein